MNGGISRHPPTHLTPPWKTELERGKQALGVQSLIQYPRTHRGGAGAVEERRTRRRRRRWECYKRKEREAIYAAAGELKTKKQERTQTIIKRR